MKRRTNKKALTLMELICVMVVLSAVMAISVPLLSKFFLGRSLEEEARRFLALTRYARSESVSRSVRMELWVDPAAGDYGLKPQAGDDNSATKQQSWDKMPLEYHLAKGLSLDVDPNELDDQGIARILFWPDGTIDEESLDKLSIHEGEDRMVEIARAEFGKGYVIETENSND
jgi:prepilin-type N-terminal cleavage/methylation domain-containing protein